MITLLHFPQGARAIMPNTELIAALEKWAAKATGSSVKELATVGKKAAMVLKLAKMLASPR